VFVHHVYPTAQIKVVVEKHLVVRSRPSHTPAMADEAETVFKAMHEARFALAVCRCTFIHVCTHSPTCVRQ